MSYHYSQTITLTLPSPLKGEVDTVGIPYCIITALSYHVTLIQRQIIDILLNIPFASLACQTIIRFIFCRRFGLLSLTSSPYRIAPQRPMYGSTALSMSFLFFLE